MLCSWFDTIIVRDGTQLHTLGRIDMLAVLVSCRQAAVQSRVRQVCDQARHEIGDRGSGSISAGSYKELAAV